MTAETLPLCVPSSPSSCGEADLEPHPAAPARGGFPPFGKPAAGPDEARASASAFLAPCKRRLVEGPEGGFSSGPPAVQFVPKQPMQEGGARKRLPTQRLKSSELRETSRASAEAAGGPAQQQVKKARTGGGEGGGGRGLTSVGKVRVGDILEMLESARRAWQSVRVVDVQGSQVQVVPQGAEASAGGSSSGWSLRWVSFREGLFRLRTALQSDGAHKGGPVSRAAAANDDDKRPERIRKQAIGFSPRSSKDTPRARAIKPKRRGEFKKKRGTERRGRKPRDRGKDNAGGDETDEEASSQGHTESESGAATGNHRRDWGLMHVDVVGRNRPPFARTLLFHGAIQAGVRYSGEPSPAKSWVVKRWPERSNRRKVDLEVHEMIRSNPCDNLVEIVDVNALDGVLMEFCNEGDLQTLLAKSRRKYMPLREVTTRFLDTMKGLAHLHKLKIVHADVSPQNIFLRPDADGALECVLGDFGHSYVLDLHSESRSSVADHCGQGAEFVAPEILAGSVSTMASDVYSAGRILSQMLSLCKQFKEPYEKESKSLVRHLHNLAAKMCAERPHDRPISAKVCKELLKAITWPRD